MKLTLSQPVWDASCASTAVPANRVRVKPYRRRKIATSPGIPQIALRLPPSTSNSVNDFSLNVTTSFNRRRRYVIVETVMAPPAPAHPRIRGFPSKEENAMSPQVASISPAIQGAARTIPGTAADVETLPPMPPELAEIYRLLSLRFNFNDPEPSPPRDEHRP